MRHSQSPVSSLQAPISAKTTLVGLIGWPVSHSVSPAMHNAAFVDLGLTWCYLPVPHKQAVMPYLDHLSPAAQAIGAVNTIRVEADGTLWGDNTDAPGFVADLRDGGVDPAGKTVLVLGAGGSARAVVYGLAEAGSRAIAICNRTLERAQSLATEMGRLFPGCPITAHLMPEEITALAAHADLIVNTTSLGMTPKVDGLPWDEQVAFSPGQVVYDLVYNPSQTRLLQKAAADGAQTIGGLGMLIWQGAIAFERWTGQSPAVAVMRRAALADLTARGVLARSSSTVPAQIRPARAADAAAIAALHREVHRLHADALPHFFQPATGDTLPSQTIHLWLASADKRFLVAEEAGGLVGYILLEIRHRPETPATQAFDLLYIEQIGVKAAARQRGIGAQLVAAAKALARKEQITTLALDVWEFNEPARRFFTGQGFTTFNQRMWMHIDT